MAWDTTVPNTFTKLSELHCSQARSGSQAGSRQQDCKVLGNSKRHIFFPVAIETVGSWSQQAIELVQEIGRCTTVITEDSRETTFLFQRLSMALQRGNVVSFIGTFPQD